MDGIARKVWRVLAVTAAALALTITSVSCIVTYPGAWRDRHERYEHRRDEQRRHDQGRDRDSRDRDGGRY